MKYTFSDIIIDPNDPRLKDAIGKEVYCEDFPMALLENANNTKENIHIFDEVDDSFQSPFFCDGLGWTCIIIKNEQSEEHEEISTGNSDIRRGDMVRIVEGFDKMIEEMKPFINEVCEVKNVFYNMASVYTPDKTDYWFWPFSSLNKVAKKYIPVDMNDYKTRRDLIGKIIISKDRKVCEVITSVSFSKNNEWFANDYTADDLFRLFTFEDGTPCGKIVWE